MGRSELRGGESQADHCWRGAEGDGARLGTAVSSARPVCTPHQTSSARLFHSAFIYSCRLKTSLPVTILTFVWFFSWCHWEAKLSHKEAQPEWRVSHEGPASPHEGTELILRVWKEQGPQQAERHPHRPRRPRLCSSPAGAKYTDLIRDCLKNPF